LALGWLRDDLLAEHNRAMKQLIQQRLVHWKGD
jgi:hypothetical protein